MYFITLYIFNGVNFQYSPIKLNKYYTLDLEELNSAVDLRCKTVGLSFYFFTYTVV